MTVRWNVTTVLDTDFNEVDAEGLLTASLVGGIRPADLGEGELVIVGDTEGNSCWGRIVRIQGPLFIVNPLWDTWRAGEAFHVQQSSPLIHAGFSTRATVPVTA